MREMSLKALIPKIGTDLIRILVEQWDAIEQLRQKE